MSLTVEVHLLSIFRRLAGSEARRMVALAEGATVRDLLDHLVEIYGPAFRELALSPDATVLVNGGNICLGEGGATRLQPGDRVTLLVSITGG